VLALDILEIVSVHDTNNAVELLRPACAMVVPCEVLRLFEHSNVGAAFGNALRDVADWDDAALVACVSAGVKAHFNIWLEANAPGHPIPHVCFLLLRVRENGVGVDSALVRGRKKGNE